MIGSKQNRGFTLIELLVVISIIALLSTIILSSIKDARDRADVRAFEQEIVNIRTAIQIYREDNNGAWPPTLQAILNAGSLTSDSLDDVAAELYSAGVYNKATINKPSVITQNGWPRVSVGEKNPKTNRYYTCDREGGNEFAIYYRDVTSTNNPVEEASFKNLSFRSGTTWTDYDGVSNSQYYYCLDIK